MSDPTAHAHMAWSNLRVHRPKRLKPLDDAERALQADLPDLCTVGARKFLERALEDIGDRSGIPREHREKPCRSERPAAGLLAP